MTADVGRLSKLDQLVKFWRCGPTRPMS